MKNAYSSIKIFHHQDALKSIEEGIMSAPLYIRIKPTNICNHHCAYCTYGSGDTKQRTENRDSVNYTDMIPKDKMLEIIEDLGEMGVKAVTFSGGGEPLTYPYIIEIVKKMKEKDIDLSLISNGQLLEGEIAECFYDSKWVRISFDSSDEDEYARLRGVSIKSYKKVIDNIKSFSAKKSKNCILGINYVVSKSNYKRVYETAELVKELGVDNIKYAAVVGNEKHYHEQIKDEVIEQIYKAKKNLETKEFQIINNYENDWMDKQFDTQPFDTCYTCRLVTVIAADQKVYLCHTRAYDSKAIVGDIKNKSFRDLWFSEETKNRLFELNPKRDCKNFCVYEERNRFIQAYLDVNYNHINFI